MLAVSLSLFALFRELALILLLPVILHNTESFKINRVLLRDTIKILRW